MAPRKSEDDEKAPAEDEFPARELGQIVRQLRTDRKLTIEELADEVKVHPTSISRIERGAGQASWPTLTNLAKSFDLKLSELIIMVEDEVDRRAVRDGKPTAS